MEEEVGRSEQLERARQLESYNNVAKGKRRTYFFDLKTTKDAESFVSITESKRCKDSMGQFFYEKHRIYVYPDDLDNFIFMLTQFSNSLKNKKSYNCLIKKSDKIKSSGEETAAEAELDYNYSLETETGESKAKSI